MLGIGLFALLFVVFAVNDAPAGERKSRCSNNRNNRNNRRNQSRTVSFKSGKIKRLGEGDESQTVSLRERHEKAKSNSHTSASVPSAASAASLPPALKALLLRRMLERQSQQASNATERSTMVILPPVDEDPFAKAGEKPPRDPKEKGL